MGLTERLRTLEALGVAPPGVADARPATGQKTHAFWEPLKARLHEQLVAKLDLSTIDKLPPLQVTQQLQQIIGELMGEVGNLPLNRGERAVLTAELIDEVTGLGPLEALLRDSSISDILVNTASKVYIERDGRLERAATRFRDNDHLQQIINRIVSRVGRRVDDSSPMVDARLPDGSRVNAVIPPLALDGPLLSIRRFGGKPLRFADLVSSKSITPHMVGLLAACVRAKVSILISGGTGTGKTTLLNAMSAFIPPSERVVTIEDAAELQLQQEHVARLETRPANVEGRGEIVARDLVRNALRMRPDRIIVGEVRGAEVMDMLQAMNTGHEGSMTTIHANTPRDAITRMESMAGMSGVTLSESLVRQTISRSLEVIVQLSRGTDGKRRISSISEITGMEGNVITMQEIFLFQQRGTGEGGQILGEFVATGVRPRVLEKIARYGVDPMTIAREFGAE
jgi:pilus assembly protein CpaF